MTYRVVNDLTPKCGILGQLLRINFWLQMCIYSTELYLK